MKGSQLVRTQGGDTEDHNNKIAPRLNTKPLSFHLSVGCTYRTHPRAPRCMLFFADDIVLLGESKEELNGRLETWRQALETYGLNMVDI